MIEEEIILRYFFQKGIDLYRHKKTANIIDHSITKYNGKVISENKSYYDNRGYCYKSVPLFPTNESSILHFNSRSNTVITEMYDPNRSISIECYNEQNLLEFEQFNNSTIYIVYSRDRSKVKYAMPTLNGRRLYFHYGADDLLDEVILIDHERQLLIAKCSGDITNRKLEYRFNENIVDKKVLLIKKDSTLEKTVESFAIDGNREVLSSYKEQFELVNNEYRIKEKCQLDLNTRQFRLETEYLYDSHNRITQELSFDYSGKTIQEVSHHYSFDYDQSLRNLTQN